jgi:hypothetical protein
MLKNMAIHELAVLATYYGVTVENIKAVTPDAEYSEARRRAPRLLFPTLLAPALPTPPPLLPPAPPT